MITIQSGKMIIPEEERFVGFAGDNHANTKQFMIPGAGDSGSVYSLYLRFDDDTVSSAPLTPQFTQDGLVLTWNIASRDLLKSGIVMAQLRIADSEGGIEHSGRDYFIVSASAELADDGSEIDVLSRSEFEERMADAVREAKAIAPYVGDDGYWYVWSSQSGEYERSVRADSVEIDSAVSASSANPVENRAVKAYVDAADSLKANRSTTLAGYGITNAYTKAQVDAMIPDVPTKTSDLINDSGFLTAHQDISGKANAATTLAGYGITDAYTKAQTEALIPDISGKMELIAADVPAAADQSGPDITSSEFTALAVGQLFKCHLSGNVTYWVKYSSSIADRVARYSELPDISGKANAATTLAGYGITDAYTKTQVDGMIPTVPTKTSDLTNDSGFLTAHQDISGKMNLITVDVDAASGQTSPDYTDTKFTSLSIGQLFICHLSGIVTYWVKVSSNEALRIARYSELPDISGKANVATTLAGYGITDAYTKTQVDGMIPTVPTKTSDLTNDSGFLTAHQDISGKANAATTLAGYGITDAYTKTQVDGMIPTVPTKTSDLTNDSGFLTAHQDISGKANAATTLAGYGITDAYTKTQVDGMIPTVPTKTSDLTNDSGFLTAHQDISGKANAATTLAGYGITDAYTKTQVDGMIPTVPTKTSDLTNDSGFLTAHQDISGKANAATTLAGYGITDAYTKTQVDGMIPVVSGKMDLPTAEVPAESGQTAPDTASSAYAALAEGQMFICYLSGRRTYWVKSTDGSHDPAPYRMALYSDVPTVPTKTSDLTNDSGFLTSHQDISGKANAATTLAGYGITDAYTKAQTDAGMPLRIACAGDYDDINVTFAASNFFNPGSNQAYSLSTLMTAVNAKYDKCDISCNVIFSDLDCGFILALTKWSVSNYIVDSAQFSSGLIDIFDMTKGGLEWGYLVLDVSGSKAELYFIPLGGK